MKKKNSTQRDVRNQELSSEAKPKKENGYKLEYIGAENDINPIDAKIVHPGDIVTVDRAYWREYLLKSGKYTLLIDRNETDSDKEEVSKDSTTVAGEQEANKNNE
jgi:hypothetical protein